LSFALPRLPSPYLCPLSCTCCQCCAIATAVPPTFYPHTPTPGRGPVLPGRTCARALTHTRGRSPAYVPQPTPPGHPSPFSPFSVPLPRARHHFRVAAMAVPSAFGTHTNTRNRGSEPLLHLSVTVLDVPPCRRREPQRTGARVSVEPSTPSSNLLATLTPNTTSPKSAHILSLCRRRARAVGFVSPPWPGRRRLHKCERIHPRGRPPLLSLSNPCTHARQGETLPP
jgi:hypothetical protein